MLPIYTTSLVFRTFSIAISITYLGPLASFFIAINIAITAIISHNLGFEKKDTFLLACTNICIMSIGPLKAAGGTRQSRFKFLICSSVFNFLVSTGAMVAVVVLVLQPVEGWTEVWLLLRLTKCGDTSLLVLVVAQVMLDLT